MPLTKSAPLFDDRAALRAALALAVGLTVLRVAVLFATPLQLYPDEAQYWLWSRHLDFGYFSKPPMIAWLIAATTALGGDSEGWVRLAAPLLHGGVALILFFLARRLYDARTGLAACALYSLIPGVQLSSGVISTDAPLLFFGSLSLLAYAAMAGAERQRKVFLAAGAGAALGLAFLSKYAALYGVGGLILHAAFSRDARRAWTPSALLAFVAALAVVVAPNIAWNAAHHFATVGHTAANADLQDGGKFSLAGLGEFLLGQLAVFGPIPSGVLLVGLGLAAARRRLAGPDLLLACFALPPLLAVSVQAFVSRANANWTAAAFGAGAVLAAAWLRRWNARPWLAAAVVTQGLAAALFLVWTVSPRAADAMGMANAFKRARGWSDNVAALVERAKAEGGAARLSAVAVDDRFLFNAAAYYGRGYFGHAGAPPLRMWVHESRAHNQAEAEAPLTAADGRRVLAVSLDQVYGPKMAADFAKVSGRQIATVRLDYKRKRRLDLFIGEDFAPKPRDPVTGRPADAAWPAGF